MDRIANATAPEAALAIPRFEDGFVNMQELPRQLAESVVNEIMSAEADQLCESAGNSGNGHGERRLTTRAGTLALRTPKPRAGSFFPDDVPGRCQHVDRVIVAAVSETYATGTSTRKVEKAARAMGIEGLSKDQASAMCERLGSEAGELVARPLGGLRMPCPWVDATYVKCRRGRRVASAAVVTAIGADEDGWRHVPGIGVVDTGSRDSWSGFLGKVKAGGVPGAQLVASDAHEGLRRAIEETFQGAAWQRCVVHLMRDAPPTGPRIPASPSQKHSALSHPVATLYLDLGRGARPRAARARGPCPRLWRRGCRRRPAWSPAPSRARGGHRRATAPTRARGPSHGARRRPSSPAGPSQVPLAVWRYLHGAERARGGRLGSPAREGVDRGPLPLGRERRRGRQVPRACVPSGGVVDGCRACGRSRSVRPRRSPFV